jgi:hypothetical protein
MTRTRPYIGASVLVLAGLIGWLAPPGAHAAESPRSHLDVREFARVPPPGYPANAAVGPDGRAYVGSYTSASGDTSPSRIFSFNPDGSLARTYVVQGQDVASAHGVTAAAVDAAGVLYVLDQTPPRVLQLDPRTGAQHVYANLRNVAPCQTAGQSECSMTSTDNAPSPDFAAFGPDGRLYVTDFQQGLIWEIDCGGGGATHVHVWFTSPLLDGVLYGPAGIQLTNSGHTLMFSVFTALGAPQATNPATGKLYTLSISPDGNPIGLHRLWESRPGDAPDGFAIARSGHVYVALGGPATNQLAEISATGTELARIPATPLDNAAMPLPFDEPSGVTFDGERLLVTNLSYLAGDPTHWAIFDIFAGEPGLALFHPRISSDGHAR